MTKRGNRPNPYESRTGGLLSKTPSLPDLTYRHIRNAIISQQLRPGEWVRQEELANFLGVSRLPVREALSRLDAEGLVVLKPRQGYYVMSLDAEEITEVFAIRGMIEGRTGYLATIRRTQVDIDYLEGLYQRIESLIMAGHADFTEFARYNFMFHDRLHELSRMKHARRILHSLNDIAERYVRMGASLSMTVQQAQDDHREILDSFRDGDAERTEAMCRRHCEQTGQRLLEYLRKASPDLDRQDR